MNLALLLTSENSEDIASFCKEASLLQKSPVNGGLVVVHHDGMSVDVVKSLTSPLLPLFPSATLVKAAINHKAPPDGKLASLFSTFLMAGYSLHPGPWLIVDGPGNPRAEDFLTKLDFQHRAYGGTVTGRGTRFPGSFRPVGPITLELSQKSLKLLRYPSLESWRERGQFLFARVGYGVVSLAEYLFHTQEKEEPAVPVAPANLEDVNPKVGPVPDVERPSRADVWASIPQPILAPLPTPQPPAPPPKKTKHVETELLDRVEALTGKRPHHFTGKDKLEELISEAETLSPP